MKTGVKIKSYGLRKFFKVLTLAEKRGLVRTAQHLLKVQRADNGLIAEALPLRKNTEFDTTKSGKNKAGGG